MNKIRLLIITHSMPFPLNKGGNQAQFHMINHLRNLVDISMIFPVTKDQQTYFSKLSMLWDNVTIFPYLDINKRSSIEKVFIKTAKYIHKKLKTNFLNSNKIDCLRANIALNTSPPIIFDLNFLEWIMKVIRENCFDIIQVEFYPYLYLIHILPNDVKTIFVHHEIRYIRNNRELEIMPLKTLQDSYLFHLYKSCELSALQKYTFIITLTDIDKAELKKVLPEKEIFSSPAVIQKHSLPIDKQYQFNNKLVYVGSSDHFPNLDAIHWFLSTCWDKICEKNDKLEFHIIGDWKKSQIAPYTKKYKNVYFDGFVDDLYKAIDNCIMVIPLRIGSGMRMKIIDAVNARIPFASTTIGIEGLDFKNEEDCLIADSIAFVDAILKMVNNKSLQHQVIINAQKVLNDNYSPNDLFERRFMIYKYLLSNPIET